MRPEIAFDCALQFGGGENEILTCSIIVFVVGNTCQLLSIISTRIFAIAIVNHHLAINVFLLR